VVQRAAYVSSTDLHFVWPPGDCLPLRFMINAWLCARYKFLYYYYFYIICSFVRLLFIYFCWLPEMVNKDEYYYYYQSLLFVSVDIESHDITTSCVVNTWPAASWSDVTETCVRVWWMAELGICASWMSSLSYTQTHTYRNTSTDRKLVSTRCIEKNPHKTGRWNGK